MMDLMPLGPPRPEYCPAPARPWPTVLDPSPATPRPTPLTTLAGTLLLTSSLACAHQPAPSIAIPLEPPHVEDLEVGQTPAIGLDHEGRPVIVSLDVPPDGVAYPLPLAFKISRRASAAASQPWHTEQIPLSDANAPRWPFQAWIPNVEPDGAALLIDVQDDDSRSPAPMQRWRLNAAGKIETLPAPSLRWTPDTAVVARWESQRDTNYVDPLAHRMLRVEPTVWLWNADWVDAGYPKRGTQWVEVPARLGGDHVMIGQCPVIPAPEGKVIVASPFAAAYDDQTLWVALGVRARDCMDGPQPCAKQPPEATELMVGICRDWRWTLLPVTHEGQPVAARHASAVLDANHRFHIIATEMPHALGDATYIRLDPPAPSPG